VYDTDDKNDTQAYHISIAICGSTGQCDMLPAVVRYNRKYTLSNLDNTVIFAKTDDEVSQSRRVLLGQLIASGSMGEGSHLLTGSRRAEIRCGSYQ
jgi:hypothetical protein